MKTIYRNACERLSRISDIALLFARVVLGWLVILHAWTKFHQKGGVPAFQGLLTSLHNVPFPTFTGAVIPWMELVFGALLIVGALTRVAAFGLAVELAIIAFLVKLHDSHLGVVAAIGAPLPGAELEFAFIAGLVLLLFMGPGQASADAALRLDGRKAVAVVPVPRSKSVV